VSDFGAGGIAAQVIAIFPFLGGSDGPRYKATAVIGTNIMAENERLSITFVAAPTN
jgi:hypothetical protein